jgi:RNA polymerase sigma-70 factor (ECF subfamily)
VETQPQEESFIERLRAGDAAAFETLVRTHMPAMLRVARRFMHSEEDARDVVQDAFVSAYRSIGSFGANARLSTWLHRIVVNAALQRLRSKRRHPEEDIEELLPRFRDDGHQVVASEPWAENAETIVGRMELQEIVRNAIDQLPDTSREVLLLRDIEELSTDEAAEVLNVTPNAVKVRLHRARQALRALLDPYMRPVTS